MHFSTGDAAQRSPAIAASTHNALMAPSLSLASCVRAYLTRSTVAADLRPEQRYNHFPASPWCSITWLLQGESECLRRGDARISEFLPTVSFIGPHTVPVVSFNPGPVRSFMAILIPQALQAMAGIDLADLVNCAVPLDTVFNAPWQAMAQAVLQAPDDASRVCLVNAFLEPRWAALRSDVMPRLDRSRYWIEGLALQAATSGAGKSQRQAERRIKQWAGLPLRDLRRMARGEDSFHQARLTAASDIPNWVDIAADSGYADQSHLCRETRRITGLSPTELKKAIEEDESFWLYRLWE